MERQLKEEMSNYARHHGGYKYALILSDGTKESSMVLE